MVKKSDKPEEGSTYYFAPGGSSFKAPKMNADGIYKILDNKVIEEGITKQQRILFQKPVQISVMNLKTKEVDADLSSTISDMANEDSVALNFAIQRAWRDMVEWGPALYNPVWDYEGSEFRMKKLKRLEPWSFANTGTTVSYIQNKILPGICINDKTQETEYWQTDSKGKVTRLTNVEVLTDPIKSGLGGTPAIVPIFPFVKMLTYSWMRQMQKVNQYGSGGIWFLKVTDPTGEDKKFAQNLMNNVSSINRYQLKPNMTIENLGMSESGSALETITQIGMEIRQFFTPAGLIQKDGGTLLGGSSGPEFDLYMAFTAGHYSNVEAYIRRLFNPYLVYNGYYDKGYRIVAKFPEVTVDKSELYLKIHDSGSNQGTLLPNEKRALLRAALPQQAGIDISDLDDPGLADLEAYSQRSKPQQFNPQLQKLQIASEVMKNTPLEPNRHISKKAMTKLVQATLGIEEGAE
ncbi:MAG: hypothetical protein Q8R70_04955 [Methanoregula sp.]|nr:hypothetical protein [Methanoregula sp.]